MKNLFAFVLVVAILMLASDSSFAGAFGGSKVGQYRVVAGSVNTHHVVFRAGEMARVWITGAGDTDLDVYVYDEFGNLIDLDEGPTDRCFASFIPNRLHVFTITVVNHGNVYNRYRLQTN